MLRAVTFDFWNTLVQEMEYREQRIERIRCALSELGISRDNDEIRKAYLASNDYAHKVWNEENYRFVSSNEKLDLILQTLSAEMPESLKQRLLMEIQGIIMDNPPALIEGVKATLRVLHQNYQMGIICDTGTTPGQILRKVLDARGILCFFATTMFSNEVGYNKPHRLMFETALKKLEVSPSEAVHVGDLLHTDISGANEAGMKAVWFNCKGIINQTPFKPDYSIKSFAEIVKVVRVLNNMKGRKEMTARLRL